MQRILGRFTLGGSLLWSTSCAGSVSYLPSSIVAAGIALATVGTSHAQSTYDVSTVKPAKPGETGMMLNWAHTTMSAKNVTLGWILTSAFHARKDQIADVPGWAGDQHFDITAKLTEMDEDTASKLTEDQHRALLLALLTERFGLKYHLETKQMAVYDLAPAKGGLKLTPAADSGDKTKQVHGMCSGCSSWGKNQVTGHDIDVTAFAEMLAVQLQRTVNDRTGFTGKIDVKLRWAQDVGAEPASDEDAGLPPLPEALEKQMGLHLIPAKALVTIYVIDHLDKPSDN
jgi:uncharacterized protein (TIGR03435 family)